MNFEDELRQLITKHGLSDVEITYKKKVILSAITAPSHETLTQTAPMEEEESDIARRYASGRIGTIT